MSFGFYWNWRSTDGELCHAVSCWVNLCKAE